MASIAVVRGLELIETSFCVNQKLTLEQFKALTIALNSGGGTGHYKNWAEMFVFEATTKYHANRLRVALEELGITNWTVSVNYKPKENKCPTKSKE